MRILIMLISAALVLGCAKQIAGPRGPQGPAGYGMGIVPAPATPNQCPTGSNGGTQFTTFQDLNNNGILDSDETVFSISVVCGGVAGQNGQDGASASLTFSLANAGDCPSGGYILTTQSGISPPKNVPICNGVQGLQGLQGIPGTQVSPVKFCASDNSAFPEYGLLVGTQLFGVYWGSTPASGGASQAFLALLTPNSYRSTGGNGCYFMVNSDNSVTE